MPLKPSRNVSFICSTVFKIFLVVFMVINILLLYYIYDKEQQPECLRVNTCLRTKKHRTLPREKWGQTIYFDELFRHFIRYKDEWRLTSSSSLISEKSADLNCSSLLHFDKIKFIAAGYTKSTYKAQFKKQIVSLKTVNIDGHDIKSCLADEDRYLYDCYLLVAAKLLKEITILQDISHKNVVKILGYCIPAEPDFSDPRHSISILEEYGEAVNVINLLQLSWEDRLRISLGLSRLLKHLSSFKEPIALNDFRRQQFIVVEGEPKLIDVDDVGLKEQRCEGSPCCTSHLSINTTICTPCVNTVCHGHNEKMNIIKTGRYFIKHILPYGAPNNLNSLTHKITSAFEYASWNADSILREMEDLTSAFTKGVYRNVSKIGYMLGFKVYPQKDISNKFDYRCQLTISGYGCIASVLDEEEAAELCWMDSRCKAFILTNTTTWTGRKIAQFKSGFGKFLPNNQTTLFLKL